MAIKVTPKKSNDTYRKARDAKKVGITYWSCP